MGLATLIAIPAFERKGIQRLVRIAFLANALMTPLIAIVYFYPRFSYNLLALAFPWALTAPLCMLLLALTFRKHSKQSTRVDETEKNLVPTGLLATRKN